MGAVPSLAALPALGGVAPLGAAAPLDGAAPVDGTAMPAPVGGAGSLPAVTDEVLPVFSSVAGGLPLGSGEPAVDALPTAAPAENLPIFESLTGLL